MVHMDRLCYFCAVAYVRYYLDKWVHFFTAHSRHGTHSPFVYRLVDEVIYAKRLPGEPQDKVARLVERLIGRFQCRTLYTLGSEPEPTAPLDFVRVDCSTYGWPVAHEIDALWPRLHAGSVLVLSAIYRDAQSKALWQSIKAHPHVTVTVDLFRVGLVFFHAGQAKEDFKIRWRG